MGLKQVVDWSKAFYILTPVPFSDQYAQAVVAAMVRGGAEMDMHMCEK